MSDRTSARQSEQDEQRRQQATRTEASGEKLVSVYDLAPEGYDGSCLRPLGMCDLGGSCEACWYNPDHPRFKK